MYFRLLSQKTVKKITNEVAESKTKQSKIKPNNNALSFTQAHTFIDVWQLAWHDNCVIYNIIAYSCNLCMLVKKQQQKKKKRAIAWLFYRIQNWYILRDYTHLMCMRVDFSSPSSSPLRLLLLNAFEVLITESILWISYSNHGRHTLFSLLQYTKILWILRPKKHTISSCEIDACVWHQVRYTLD